MSEAELWKLLVQIPLVGVTAGFFFWVVRILRQERDKTDAREAERDARFTQALKESAELTSDALDRNTDAIDRNNTVIRDLDRTITTMKFRSGNGDT